MATDTKNLLELVGSWPQEDVEELEEYARFIEARRTGVYRLTADERAAIKEGVAQADRGEFVSDEVVAEADKRHGI
jgi:hypothetical protein